MKTNDLLNIFVVAFLAALFIWQYGTKSGRNYRARQLRELADARKAKLEGTYVTPRALKVRFAILGTLFYGFLSGVVAATFGGGSFFYVLIPVGLLLGGLFAFFALKIADTAEQKHRSWNSFFWLSLLVSPILTWIIVTAISSEKVKTTQTPETPAKDAGVTERLIELKKLADSGVITSEEFEAKKQELLRRI